MGGYDQELSRSATGVGGGGSCIYVSSMQYLKLACIEIRTTNQPNKTIRCSCSIFLVKMEIARRFVIGKFMTILTKARHWILPLTTSHCAKVHEGALICV
jgi:hypothetical protein